MGIDFSESGKVKIEMEAYSRKILAEFPEVIGPSAETPAGDQLFDVRDEKKRKILPEEQAQIFHKTVAQLLFLVCRPRRDMRTAVAFLTTRVKEPDEDDWAKLRRALRYLKRNPSLALTMEAHDLSLVQWWVDASFAVHPD